MLITSMTAPMASRGPDGSDTFIDVDAGVAFGHRRLAVIDLSEHGNQPMISSNGRYVITYNGEIYNHSDLAAELRGTGCRFRGHSDTEVLLEALSTWGLSDTLDHIDGMFAFALWDRQDRSLTLARDRMGEKPLYFGRIGAGEIVFASSLDALRAHPGFDQAVDRNALTLYLRYKYVPAPWSIYRDVKKLEPGCTIRVESDGRIGPSSPYWSLFEVVSRGRSSPLTPEEAADELDRLLRRSVRRRMFADVPVGAFLSGGIDSSTVVGVAQAESSLPVRTFTIGAEVSDFNESEHAARVSKHLGTEHTSLVVTAADSLAMVERLGVVYDEPFGDSSQIPTRLVSELARRDVTVALSGDAGDELFGGYNRYRWVPSIWRRLEHVPLGTRRRVARLLHRLPPAAWDALGRTIPESRRPQQLALKVAKVLDVADAADPAEVFHRLVSHWNDPAALVLGGCEPPTIHTQTERWPELTGIVEQMIAIDSVTYLPDDILAKVDRAAMSVSLETRIPLLDRDVIEFAASLPLSILMERGRTKAPLRRVLDRYVPLELVDRPKSGFGLPIDDWLRGPLRSWAEDRLFSDVARSFLASPVIRSAWDDHLAGRSNLAYHLWDVLMFVEWATDRRAT